MESVIYSISFGKQTIEKRVTYQAFSAAISQQMHVDMVMNFVARRQKIRDAKTCIVAYRLSKPDSMSEMEQSHSSKSLHSETNRDGIIEGYDDGNETGCGEKLLS